MSNAIASLTVTPTANGNVTRDPRPHVALTPTEIDSTRVSGLRPYVFDSNGRLRSGVRRAWQACHAAGADGLTFAAFMAADPAPTTAKWGWGQAVKAGVIMPAAEAARMRTKAAEAEAEAEAV